MSFIIAMSLAADAAMPAQASASAPAIVQEAAPAGAMQEPEGLGDIVVTAQRREERLQNVPIAITAVTSAQLQLAKVETAYDLTKVALTLTVNKSAVYAVPFLRGVGTTNILVGDEPSVATHVDGFYKGPALAAILPFNNIERIEVRRGPQGTLYGRNATDGLINLITTAPRDAFFGKGSVGYGNADIFEADAYVTGPVSDSVRADLSARIREQGKLYVRNLFTGNRIGAENLFALCSKVAVDLSGAVVLTLTADFAKAENDLGAAQSNLPGTIPIGALYSTRPYFFY